MGIRFTPATLFPLTPGTIAPSRLDTSRTEAPQFRAAFVAELPLEAGATAFEQAVAPATTPAEEETATAAPQTTPGPTFPLFNVTPPGVLIDLIA